MLTILAELPHPDDIKVPKKELGSKKADTSDSSDEEDNKNGYVGLLVRLYCLLLIASANILKSLLSTMYLHPSKT